MTGFFFFFCLLYKNLVWWKKITSWDPLAYVLTDNFLRIYELQSLFHSSTGICKKSTTVSPLFMLGWDQPTRQSYMALYCQKHTVYLTLSPPFGLPPPRSFRLRKPETQFHQTETVGDKETILRVPIVFSRRYSFAWMFLLTPLKVLSCQGMEWISLS